MKERAETSHTKSEGNPENDVLGVHSILKWKLDDNNSEVYNASHSCPMSTLNPPRCSFRTQFMVLVMVAMIQDVVLISVSFRRAKRLRG